MRITGLNVYPVKSLQGIALEMARLPETGLAFDKHFGEISVLGEPLRTLVEMNTRSLKGGFFGQHAILLDGEGRVLSLGDRLAVMPASGAGLLWEAFPRHDLLNYHRSQDFLMPAGYHA